MRRFLLIWQVCLVVLKANLRCCCDNLEFVRRRRCLPMMQRNTITREENNLIIFLFEELTALQKQADKAWQVQSDKTE